MLSKIAFLSTFLFSSLSLADTPAPPPRPSQPATEVPMGENSALWGQGKVLCNVVYMGAETISDEIIELSLPQNFTLTNNGQFTTDEVADADVRMMFSVNRIQSAVNAPEGLRNVYRVGINMGQDADELAENINAAMAQDPITVTRNYWFPNSQDSINITCAPKAAGTKVFEAP